MPGQWRRRLGSSCRTGGGLEGKGRSSLIVSESIALADVLSQIDAASEGCGQPHDAPLDLQLEGVR